MLTIGQIAHLAGTTVRAVRHYHQTGLLPEPPRGPNGYRRYGSGDLDRLLQIRELGELGLALADVRRLVTSSASDRREALRSLRDQYAEQEQVLADRRARITRLLSVEGDPAIPTPLRAYINSLQAIGAPPELLAMETAILRISDGFMAADDQQAMAEAMVTMADDPATVAAVASHMQRFDAVAQLSPDHPDVAALTRDYAAFLQATWPDLADVQARQPEVAPERAWLVQDLLAERLTPTQIHVLRGAMERVTGAVQTTAIGEDASPAS